ncbi:MAG TPA: SH3 domain-containing protein [Kofleriaceae bacterium]|jgi:hypothetical protein|nr:SH3 domain-containing protein [Kofleriaceae bacterium]
MSVKVLLVVLLLGIVAWPKPGHAEKVKTNQSTKLYSRAGEQSPVILTVKSGQLMTLLAQDGRWLKVRTAGRTGWIPRSKVDMPDGEEEIARNTRRRPFVDGRGTKRGFGGEGGPEDRIGADAAGDAGDEGGAEPRSRSTRSPKGDDDGDDQPSRGTKDPDGDDGTKEASRTMAHVSEKTVILNDPKKDSDESFTAGPKTVLYVGESTGTWTFVETDEGDAGYVLTSKLDIEEPQGGSGGRMRAIDARGRLGVTLVRQSLSTPGAMGVLPENYSASSSSLTIALGGSVLYPYRTRYWVGGELTYDFDKAIPGISYMNQTISFSYHVFNLRAVAGYDLQKKNGMTVYGRLGLHYDSFQVADVANFTQNTAKLPNQTITAPTLGGALSIPRLTKEIGLKVSLDVILLGSSVAQTKNLEDGTDPSTKALFLGGVFSYRWKPKMDLQATYDLTYESLSFSGLPPPTSQRGHMGTAIRSGSDLNNALSVGIAYAF